MTQSYEIKCDDCKATIRLTDSLSESAAGGRCESCRDLQAALRDLATTLSPRPSFMKAGDELARQGRG